MLPRPTPPRNPRNARPRPGRVFCATCGAILLLVLAVALVAHALLPA